MTNSRLWVVPGNDGEAVEIQRLLREHSEQTLLTAQPWGATWAGLETEIHTALAEFRQSCPGGAIYGIELAGPNNYGAVDIDHHKYTDCDRSHPLTALEQVAEILGARLSRWRQLVAANDRGYIPAMVEAGATPEEITAIRAQDRAAQGIGPQQEAQAERDLKDAEWHARKVQVWCPQGVTAAHSDRLYGRAEESLLGSPQEWVYYGPRHRELASLKWGEATYSGGDNKGGYFGLLEPGEASRAHLRELFWEHAPSLQSSADWAASSLPR